MSSPGQKRGSCGHAMAVFDQHSYCARCREKNKGKDPCVESKDTTSCKFCSAFTPEQLAQISTPSYKIKKERCEARKSVTATPTKDSSELMDPASVSVIGVVGQEGSTQHTDSVKSPPSSSVPPKKKAKKEKATVKPKKSSDSSSTDSKIADLDSKWSERFNRLEALLLSNSFQPSFSSEVKLTLSHSHPTNIPRDSEPFFFNLQGALAQPPLRLRIRQPASQSRTLSLQLQSALARVPLLHSINRPASLLPTDLPQDRLTGTLVWTLTRVPLLHSINPPTSQPPDETDVLGILVPTLIPDRNLQEGLTANILTDQLLSPTPAPLLFRGTGRTVSSDNSGSVSDFSDRPAVDLCTEEGELSDDPELTTEPELIPSEEQMYRETMKGIREYMGWSDIPELDSANTGSDDNPFSRPKAVTPGKVSVQMPTEDWLCKKIGKLNLTLVEGYPSCSSEAGPQS